MVALSVLLALVGCGSSVSWELLKGDCVPNGEEVWYDGVDQDCDGNDDDQDGDGISVDEDCWDDPNDGTFLVDAVGSGLTLTADQIFPGAEEAWYDGVDQDCDGASDFDQDGDGFESANDEQADGSVGDDCVDGGENDEVFEDSCSGELIIVDPEDAASVNQDATDTFYDGVDQNCDGADDNDADGDGYAVCDECDDTDADIFPNDSTEVYYDCVDQNCDGNDGDRDGDGYVDAEYTASCAEWATINPGRPDNDCDDDDTTISPAAEEGVGDGKDQNCDGSESCYDDDDDDGYRDDAGSVIASVDLDCTDPGEATASDPTGDCDDKNGAINPGGKEVCDASNADEDCDGKADNDDLPSTGTWRYYKDTDGDTYGDSSDIGALRCDADTTYKVTNNTDCNDSSSSINTAATEIAGDEVDQNCDSKETCYKDSDNDGYRPDSTSTVSSSDTDCVDSGEAKSTEATTDCDDTNASRYPTNTEITGDSVDQDCDLKEVCFIDVDNDGYYLSSGTVTSSDTDCSDSGEGSTSDISGDCNDGNSAINAGASELTGDEVDQNCDNKETCYLDDDNDGYRPDSGTTKASTDTDCQDTDEALATDPTGDCNDAVATIYLGASEVVGDGIDQSCDGKETCYKDTDNDGYRPDSSSTVASSDSDCTDSGEALSSDPTGDCDDSESTAYLGATEVCDVDDVDEDCDGLANDDDSDATGRVMYYPDVDNDSFGDADDPGSLLCDTTATYEVADNTDCDDSTTAVRPNRTSDACWDGLDNDCDVVVDEGSSSTACYTGGELVISELFIWGDATTDPLGEWFEVYNPSATNTVYMESMIITRQNSGAGGNISFTVDEVVAVAPQQTVVFCYTDTYLGSLCDFEYGAITGSNFALTQTSTTTLVIATTAADVTSRTLDSVNYNGAMGTGSAGTWPGVNSGYSYELETSKLTAAGNDIGSNWCETTGSAYYTASGKSDYGTPNATNTCP